MLSEMTLSVAIASVENEINYFAHKINSDVAPDLSPRYLQALEQLELVRDELNRELHNIVNFGN